RMPGELRENPLDDEDFFEPFDAEALGFEHLGHPAFAEALQETISTEGLLQGFGGSRAQTARILAPLTTVAVPSPPGPFASRRAALGITCRRSSRSCPRLRCKSTRRCGRQPPRVGCRPRAARPDRRRRRAACATPGSRSSPRRATSSPRG